MATKISALDELTSLSGSDLSMVLKDDGGGAYTAKKAQASNIPRVLSPTTVGSSPRTITSADNGALITNAGTALDITLNMDTRANLGARFEVTIANEVGVNDAATGGTITYLNNDVIHTFLTSGTFTPSVPLVARVLVVGGGGSGGYSAHGIVAGDGGGAGGGVSYNAALAISAVAHTVTVGAGAVVPAYGGADKRGITGGASSLGALMTAGGGEGGYQSQLGAGGGTSGTPQSFAGGTGGQVGGPTYYTNGAGGGGGAGAVGANKNGEAGGNGGAGISSDIYDNTTRYYGGGGGGGSGSSSIAYGLGGLGGGGNGGCTPAPKTGAQAGTANTGGGGGGGCGSDDRNGAGGAGIVIIRYAQINSSRITIAPASGEKLPGANVSNNRLKSYVKNNVIKLRTTSNRIISMNGSPSANGWVDTTP